MMKRKTAWLLFPVYLLHISAMVGISLGYADFFLPKSFINLMICFILLILALPKQPIRSYLIPLTVAFAVGMLVEIIGVSTGVVFGEYQYGNGLGPKVAGVPWIIGINWALLVFITYDISKTLNQSIWVRSAIGASLMVLLDFAMEHVAPVFDYWEFEGGMAGPINYVAWWVVAFILHAVFNRFEPKGNPTYSAHLFVVQLIFFVYFYARTAI